MLDKIFEKMDETFAEMDKTFDKVSDFSFGYKSIKTLREYSTDLTGKRTPKTNLQENEKEIIVNYEIPGVDKKDIKIDVTENQIEIYAKKKEETKKGKKFMEFYKLMTFPSEITREGIKTNYRDGILKIIMPKAEKTNKT